MKSRYRNTGIIVLIALICILVLMSFFDLWTRLGIDKSLEKVAIVISGFLGVVFARMILRLLFEFIRWIIKMFMKLFFEFIEWTIKKTNNKSTLNKS